MYDKSIKRTGCYLCWINFSKKNYYQSIFSARFDKQDEDAEVLDKTDSFNNLNNNHNLMERDINSIDTESPSELQVRNQQTKYSGWMFDKIKSMTI